MNEFALTMNLLNTFLALSKCIIDFALFYWFSMQFFNQRWRRYKIVPYVLLLILAVFLFFVNRLRIPQLNTATAFVCTLVINFLLFKGNVAAQLICSIVEVLLIVICEFIPISVYSLIHVTNIGTITNEVIRNAGFNLISTAIFSVIILLARYLVTLKRQQANRNISITENLSIAIVPIVSMCVIYYILDINYLNADNTHGWNSLFIYFGLLLMNLVLIIGDNNLKKRYQLQKELDELSCLKQLNKSIIEQQDQYIDNLKGFAHDFTKQLNGLNHIIRCEEMNSSLKDELLIYESEMYKHIEDSYRFVFIPTLGLRSILSQTQLHCDSSNITFSTDIQYGDFSFIAFPDLYTLFENPLENAITACNEIQSIDLQKKIELSIIRNRDLIWIELRNTKSNTVILKNKCIQTTKLNADKHGMGIQNMKRTIKRYNGYLDFKYTSHEFSMTMTLPVVKISMEE